MLYFLTSVWVLSTPNAGENLLFLHFSHVLSIMKNWAFLGLIPKCRLTQKGWSSTICNWWNHVFRNKIVSTSDRKISPEEVFFASFCNSKVKILQKCVKNTKGAFNQTMVKIYSKAGHSITLVLSASYIPKIFWRKNIECQNFHELYFFCK